MSQRYLVLDSDPHDDGLRWNLDRALPAVLPDLGFEYRFRKTDHASLVRDIWEAAGTQAILTLMSDRATPAHYLMIEAGSDELVARISRELENVIPAMPLSTLQERAERVDEDPSALVRLALATDAYAPDPRSVDLIAAGFAHDEPLVRYRAAEAAALAPHEAFLATLEALAREDPNESVRGMAKMAADACRPAR
jgi:hypothetical protein